MAKSLKSSLPWLALQQSSDGSFSGQASTAVRPFEPAREHQTVFFTALILACLEAVEGGEPIVGPAVKFLKREQSDIGSWNYWQRDSGIATDYPYPDDLDDTACALLALTIHDPEYVDGKLLARLAKLLIATETQ